MKRLKITALVLGFALVSCTSYRAFQQAHEEELRKNWDQAVMQYQKALEIDPDNMKYKIALQQASLEASRVHFEKGKSYRAAAEKEPANNRLQLYQLAGIELELAVKLDSTNQYAAVELAKTVADVQQYATAASRNTIEAMKKAAVTKAQPPELNPASNEPISLLFSKPTSVKDIYRSLGNAFGINILFDQAVKDDEKISIELRDVTAQQALERVMQAANHFYKVLDEKTIIVVPNNPQMRRDYEDLVIQTFYLSNGDAEQVTNVVRTMIEARNVFPLKALNAITIRDTADKVRIAEKIIEANDKARAEVVVDVELLQMDVTKGREIGMQLVNSTGSAWTPSQTLLDETGKAVGSLTIDQLKDLGPYTWSLNVPSILYGFVKTNSNAELLAKPQLRISEGEKASLLIGQKIPVPVSTFTSANTGGIGNTYAPVTSFQYQDVGIKISIEPRVHHNREVTLKLTIEVSNLAGYAPATSPPQPIIGTRTIESTIRLKDGETNFLAGLIRKDKTTSSAGVPFLSEIPILGRLVSKEKKDTADQDLVLTMTPHIIRIPDITPDDLAPLWVGTQNNLTFRGVTPRIESNVGTDPFSQFQQRQQPAQTDEEEGPAEEPAPIPGPNVGPVGGSAPTNPFNPGNVTPAPPKPPRRRPPVDEQGYRVPLSPRVAPQPASLQLKPGEEKSWSVVGMDVDGLATDRIVFLYDPTVISVDSASIGPAMKNDPVTPPVIRIDPAQGRVVVTSSDGKPLELISGGEMIVFRVRGGATGQSVLALEPMSFTSTDGKKVEAAVAGGRAEVQ